MVKKISKFPQWITGLKVLKSGRKGRLAALLSTPAGQILLAELLIVIGGAIASAANRDTKTGRAFRMALQEGLQELKGSNVGKASKRDIGKHVGNGVIRAIEAFRQSMHGEAELKDAERVPPGPPKVLARKQQPQN